MTSTTEQKAMVAILGALLFVLLSLPFMYNLTNNIAPASYPYMSASGPTLTGIMVHGFVFFLLSMIIMRMTEDRSDKSM